MTIHELDIHGSLSATTGAQIFTVSGTDQKVETTSRNFFSWLIGKQLRLRVFDGNQQKDIYVVSKSARELLKSHNMEATAGLGRTLAVLLAGFSRPPSASIKLSKLDDRYSKKVEKEPKKQASLKLSANVGAFELDVDDAEKKRFEEFGLLWPKDQKFSSKITEANREEFLNQLVETNRDRPIRVPRNATQEEAEFVAEFEKRRKEKTSALVRMSSELRTLLHQQVTDPVHVTRENVEQFIQLFIRDDKGVQENIFIRADKGVQEHIQHILVQGASIPRSLFPSVISPILQHYEIRVPNEQLQQLLPKRGNNVILPGPFLQRARRELKELNERMKLLGGEVDVL